MIVGKLKKIAPLAVLVAGLLSGAAAFAADAVKIGVAGPHTGANAAFGEQFWKGAEAAAKDINDAGGINGAMIELVKADDACEPKQAVAVANRLVDNDKVTAVLGHFCSSSTIPASEIYAEANILAMTPASTNPKVTDRGLKNIMRMCGRDDQQGTVAGDYIVDKLKATKVAIIHDKDTYGQGLADATKARLNSKGVTEVLYEGLTRGEKDFNALVTKIKAAEADVVYFGGLHTEAGALIRQLREQGSKATFISGDGIVSEQLVTAAGGPQFVEGVRHTFGRDPLTIPESKEVAEKIQAAGYKPEGYTLYAYATMQSVAEALKNAGSTEGDKLADWLKANGVNTVLGKKEWDEKGDIKVSDYTMYVWDKEGKYKMEE
ncbi:MAG: branched-chain amino acid ABC transporter substrate-binding protein [Thiofilum sp.]|uniref:branched-chain amino acid ABC transporter substrate-binding protein n=1 Tax=Thiofilum sp. TaxID=2212733 RepID=UPI0025D73E91|nr:branched-chain amino acid ABC transporter substrate-binding protein [Thiofilum sp.]MBK8452828.1 branched-chain amino acid ABC transporter substrate-binding protein [Thiofilum sp.]